VAALKDRLQADLTAAMKARDELTTATLRMVLTAVGTEEVAGKTARQLSDDEVLKVLAREAKKRREAATAFRDGGRQESADRELAEEQVLERYLPEQLSTTTSRHSCATPSPRPAPPARRRWAR
jgi:uncharacterized protein YqeY